MATLVTFHAHPDDECLSTGGTIARAAAEGHRVVLVVATDGSHGEVPDDLAEGETLADRRRVETERAAAVLGIERIAWLGYHDSGMTGWEQNDHDGSFWQADVEGAAERLAQVLREERADVLTVYDWHGGYGHPDHIQVHRVGHRAAVLAGTPRVLEATMNRDHIVRLMEAAAELGVSFDQSSDQSGDEPGDEPGDEADRGSPKSGAEFDPQAPADDGNPFGTPEAELTLTVDVTEYVAQKRSAMACHASQIDDTSFFLQMPDEIFALSFGTEWFIEPGVVSDGPRLGWIFP